MASAAEIEKKRQAVLAAADRRKQFIVSQGGSPSQEALRSDFRASQGKGVKDVVKADGAADAVSDSAGGSGNVGKAAAIAKASQAMGITPAGGMGGGLISGAATGSAFGVQGAVIGGVAGAVMGAASARAARKAKNREIEAQKQRALGEIEMEKGRQINNALAGMGSRIGASLNSVGASRK